MRNPLLVPAAAFASGILLSHWFPFSMREAGWPMLAFLFLAFPSKTTWLRHICVLLSLVCGGALVEAWHRPGLAPEIDAGWKETVILSGCVVEPTIISPGRDQL